ncbi:probable LRR receptor-like serine/threonine-protein kinase At3g47570 [Arachis ipaensis]|uniref:non-specific serine/threonine protein kinase n=2 Tax=Arachis hypogaea TaxID=3818 RepID=A0A444XGV4_ARAHY|nr:probable LRR receptor-like serine/threonine-protein kinase At3g47570 [Arachis ipaensis]XP_025676251.1 probable LRR receptor-like serine/threonine-protein kinase At3g47570 [Arachis hypogaea]QHN76689.1 putative LRR receptor-like serine/threonine-protein kinase [Arachis hypogaea]RYQ88593.1 hypothetical protein Ahy_B09g095698 isoform A [Arachis hypogaea]
MPLVSTPYPVWSMYLLHASLLFYVNLVWLQPTTAATAAALGNDTDFMALLKFKESISDDPHGVLTSWNTSTHFCNWHGVTCSTKHQRVVMLNLKRSDLRGIISPYIGNLSFLRNLYLQNNSFYGEIPTELGRLFRLQQLSLSNNILTGEFPIKLTNCSDLRHLNVSSNNLHGKIPIEIGSLRKLEKLNLFTNNFSGQIPPTMWNISSLDVLSLAYNNLEGDLPEEMGQLRNLSVFAVPGNKLSGTLPASLYNMSSLFFITAAENQFHGSLPANMFSTLTNLQVFGIGANQMSGLIPTSITNASLLQVFDIGVNSFVGQVPSLGMLKDLHWLNLNYNNLGNGSDNDLDFTTSLVNCTKLENLILSTNKFGGPLPNSIGNLSTQLIRLYLGDNQIYGTIPESIGNYINLIALVLEYNQFTGTVPNTFGKLHKLQLLGLGINQLSGQIPSSLGNLTQLLQISISNNKLEGKIPPIVGNWQKLQYLELSGNNLSGAIPLEVFSLFTLSTLLNLSHNSFSGTIPVEVGTLNNLGTLDLSKNDLFGEIPTTIGECINLEYLNLQGNSFNGTIPPSIASLKSLIQLDLSQNKLSGSIPTALQSLSLLTYLNLSFNKLDGKVPTEGVFKNTSAISIAGNKKLCGGISKLHLPPCPNTNQQKKQHNLKLVRIIICVVICLLLLSILTICWSRRQKQLSSLISKTTDQSSIVSYQSLYAATERFSTNNLIGSGSFGSVYTGFLKSEDRVVAIKVINLQMRGAHKSFVTECNALRVIRHRNLVKILTCCSSIDYRGEEFKALVFEYMSNGSLEKWLHPQGETADPTHTLDLAHRLNILIDIASALHYLHYECEQPIVHCDIKPSNVLLDDDMVAHVTDFGLARILSTINGSSHNQSSTSGFKGTIGYAPPEYGIGSEVSTQGDVYSFGILVLEMLTGRRPTEEFFEDGDNLHNYVERAYPEKLLEIVDSTFLLKQLEKPLAEKEGNIVSCVFSLIKIGLACSVESPRERINMRDVIRELNVTRNAFLCGLVNVEYC